MSRRALIGMVIASLLISCSLSTEAELVRHTLDLPDLALVDAEYVLKDARQDPIAIKARTISLYDATNTAHLTDFTFSQRDSKGAVTLTGQADRAEANTKSFDATLSGNVMIVDHVNDLQIAADQLLYRHDDKLIKAESDQLVTIVYGEGKRVEGYGLDGELGHSIFSFDRIVTGVIAQ